MAAAACITIIPLPPMSSPSPPSLSLHVVRAASAHENTKRTACTCLCSATLSSDGGMVSTRFFLGSECYYRLSSSQLLFLRPATTRAILPVAAPPLRVSCQCSSAECSAAELSRGSLLCKHTYVCESRRSPLRQRKAVRLVASSIILRSSHIVSCCLLMVCRQ
jgi:hypothetical protein